MSKTSGLGAGLLVDTADLSGDITAVQEISGGPAALDVTTLQRQAMERIGGKVDGRITATAWFNPAAGGEHPNLSTLPTTDRLVTYLHRSTAGSPAVSCLGKQIDYTGNRGGDGAFTFTVDVEANRHGIEWGVLLTAGAETITSTGALASVTDSTTETYYGAVAAIHLLAFTGSSITLTVEHSNDNGATDTWYTLAGDLASFTAAGSKRVETGPDTTIKQYLRLRAAGTFTSATIAVSFHRRAARPAGIEEIDFLTADQVLFYSVPHIDGHGATATTSRLEWQLGQNDDPDFVGENGGFFFPNGTPGVDATYSFVRGAGAGGPGLNYITTQIFGVDGATSHASQMWRRSAWDALLLPDTYGSDLPLDHYTSCELYIPTQLDFLNNSGPSFGFTNLIQSFGNIGVDMHVGIGRNTTNDTYQRAQFDYDNAAFDLTQLISPTPKIPSGRWVRYDDRLKVASGGTGRWEVWIEGLKVLDYTGQTAHSGTTSVGRTWGVYGELIVPTNPQVWYRKVGITTTPALTYWCWHET